MKTRIYLAVGSVVHLLGACGSGDADGDGIRTTATADCKAWQDALLGFAQRCGANLADEARTRAVHCTSDAAALSCAAQLDAGGCEEATLEGCDATDLADRVAAEAACGSLAQAACELEMRCDGPFTSVERCVELGGGITLDCSAALGWAYTLESCLSAIDTLACERAASPPACENVIILE